MEPILVISATRETLPAARLSARHSRKFCDPYPWVEKGLKWGPNDPDLHGFGNVPDPDQDDDEPAPRAPCMYVWVPSLIYHLE